VEAKEISGSMKEERNEHYFDEFDEVEAKGCLRCYNYLGYGLHKIKDLPDDKVLWGIKVICKVSMCSPNLKPILCGFCFHTDLEKLLEKVEDEELKQTLKNLGMCPSCYEDWRAECLCLLCHFDYPNSRIPGKKGSYCFCNGCEWKDPCPEKRKSFPDCEEMREINKKNVEKIIELV
jgi:hypothetical protein